MLMIKGGGVVWPFDKETVMAAKEPTSSDAQIEAKLKDFPGWWYEDGWIRRNYKTDGWPTTLMLVNAIGYVAEAAYHHPDLSVTWGRVIVKLQNHAAGGITDKDFELARKIDDTVLCAPKAARSRGRRTSSCARATRGDGRCGGARAAPRVVRHGEARRARAAPDHRRDGSGVRVGGGGHEDHGRRPDDDPMDRPVSRGPGRYRPGAHPRAVRRRRHGDRAAGGRPSRKRAEGPAADPGILRARRPGPRLWRLRHRDRGRGEQSATSRARGGPP